MSIIPHDRDSRYTKKDAGCNVRQDITMTIQKVAYGIYNLFSSKGPATTAPGGLPPDV